MPSVPVYNCHEGEPDYSLCKEALSRGGIEGLEAGGGEVPVHAVSKGVEE